MEDQQQKKYQLMTETPVSRLIPRMALPCVVSMLVTAFYNMADTFFVGMLKSNAATGAVGVVFSLMAIIQAIGFFFGQGSGNFISREIGHKNYQEASEMASTGFFSALATGILICVLGLLFLEPLAYLLGSTDTILPYTKAYLSVILLGAPWMTSSLVLNNQLRFQGSAAYAMVGITSGAVLNIGLDPLLIFTFDMGVAGAATGTALAVVVDGQIGDARTAAKRVFARFLGFGQPADPADHSARRVVDAATPAQFAGIVVGIDRSAGLRLQSSGGDQSFDVLRVVQYLDARQVVVFPEYAQADRAGGDERRDAVLEEQFPVTFHHGPCGVDLAG